MAPLPLEEAARAAEAAADRARTETLPRFRNVGVETKRDGSPVTEADRAAELAVRDCLTSAFPQFAILGEEYGGDVTSGPCWVVDPIDGTIAFSRGIPLFTTLIALLEDGEPVLGLIDCPAIGERYVGWRGGGCRRNGAPTRVSQETDLSRAIVSHGDPFCFDVFGRRGAVLGGGVGAMVDLALNLWDAAATQILVPEAGGRCATLPEHDGKIGLVLGSPALVDQLLELFD
jgi:fructose-1,6-bisphosphatase/inositol monophosphatase family enzyme